MSFENRFDLTVVIMPILPSNTHKMCYTFYTYIKSKSIYIP